MFIKLISNHYKLTQRKRIIDYIMASSTKNPQSGSVKIMPKIREKLLGSGWVGQAPTRILILFLNFFFSCILCCLHVSKCFQKNKKWLMGWVGVVLLIRVFLGFLDFFNLTRPLSL